MINLDNCRSALADNLRTSHQVDSLSQALIPAEAVENGQEHPVAIRYSITSLVSNSLSLKNHSYV